MWLLLAVAGYALLAIVSLLDKIVVSKEKVDPLQFTFFSTVILFPVVLVTPFLVLPASATQWLAVLVGGISYTLALYTMYRSFATGEVSHNGPLIGALTPVCTFVISEFILPEPLSGRQMGAIAFLILGSLVISVTNTVTGRRGLTSVWYSVLAAAMFAVFFISAKYVYLTLGFGTGFVWITAAMGICGALLFLYPENRALLRRTKRSSKSKQPLSMMALDKVLAAAGVILIQFALSKGSPTLINALTGLQYGLLVILVAALSTWKPKIFKETYGKGEALQECIAVLLIAIGLALLVI